MRTLFLSSFLFLTLTAQAQDLITDRPDFTESAIAVPQQSWQVEGGFTWSRAGIFDTVRGPELLLRWGLLPMLELRLGAPDYVNTEIAEGFGDASIGAKLQFGPIGRWDAAAIAKLSLPTGEAGLSSGKVEPELILIAGTSLTERISLGTQVMTGYATSAEEVTLGGTLVLGVSLQERAGLFTELAVFNAQNNTPALYLHHGYTFRLLPLLQFDVHGGVGLTDTASDYFFGAGLSTRF